jgi:hypothetical protein
MTPSMRATAVALIALLLTASCGGEAAPGDAATATEQTTQEPAAPGLIEPSAEQPSEASSKFAPNVGDTALVIGETRRGMDYTTKLATYRYPYPPKLYREPKRRYEYFGIKLRQCMRPSATATEEAYSTYNGEWYIEDDKGGQFTSSMSYNDWPVPKFPETVTMTPGDCLKGWITVEVPRGTKVQKIIYRPAGETLAEWLPTPASETPSEDATTGGPDESAKCLVAASKWADRMGAHVLDAVTTAPALGDMLNLGNLDDPTSVITVLCSEGLSQRVLDGNAGIAGVNFELSLCTLSNAGCDAPQARRVRRLADQVANTVGNVRQQL